jgi:hypothetical protein
MLRSRIHSPARLHGVILPLSLPSFKVLSQCVPEGSETTSEMLLWWQVYKRLRTEEGVSRSVNATFVGESVREFALIKHRGPGVLPK